MNNTIKLRKRKEDDGGDENDDNDEDDDGDENGDGYFAALRKSCVLNF